MANIFQVKSCAAFLLPLTYWQKYVHILLSYSVSTCQDYVCKWGANWYYTAYMHWALTYKSIIRHESVIWHEWRPPPPWLKSKQQPTQSVTLTNNRCFRQLYLSFTVHYFSVVGLYGWITIPCIPSVSHHLTFTTAHPMDPPPPFLPSLVQITSTVRGRLGECPESWI